MTSEYLKKAVADLTLKYKDDLDANELSLEIGIFKYQAYPLILNLKEANLMLPKNPEKLCSILFRTLLFVKQIFICKKRMFLSLLKLCFQLIKNNL